MVKKTTNYDQFKSISANRPLNMAHLARLTLSVSKRNLLEYNPIMVNENMEVIDGQHRLEVARANKIPIYYIIVPSTDIEDVYELNTNVRNWKLIDYVDSLIVQGYKDMQFLKEFSEEYGLSYTSSIILLNGGKVSGHRNVVQYLKKLKFSELEKELARKAADLVTVIRRFRSTRGALTHSVYIASRLIAGEGADVVIAKEIERRGKIVAISDDISDMKKILDSYKYSVS